MIDIMDKNATIGNVVAQLSEASKIFDRYGIDFCCGGNRKLYDVILSQGIDENSIYKELQKAQEDRRSGYESTDYIQMSPSALSTYIEDTHHSYLRQELPEIAELLGTITRVHGANHPELFEAYRYYGVLKSDLEQHLIKEEMMLFPALSATERNQEEVSQLAIDIIGEHVAAGDILSKLREVTNNYTVPADGCGTFRLAYEKLMELENDLHQHIHLENNILLKEYDNR